MSGYDAVVLAGGAARRLGGADKPSVRVGGRTLLNRVLAACADAGSIVVVGPERPTATKVTWTREEPYGGGPVAALAAGLRHVRADTVLVLSADLPFLDKEAVRTLLTALDTPHAPGAAGNGGGGEAGASGDGVMVVDSGGQDHPLVAVYRTEALREGLERLGGEHGALGGLSLRRLTAGLSLTRLPHSTASLDCDTWEDITAARARIRDDGNVLDEWIAAVKAELGIELDVDTAALLDLARDAAHGVARPAAPLTTFLVGYAAAQQGGGPESVAEATRKAAALATRWAEEPE
ncbi:NTP transferase domain-containing protein [Streptomyces varsoviensis]|uniref:NTP transferase domain-containing protein n=1 Tax=Streptomyces varsoviensis TaxID=67373 RepID=UPI0033F92C42